MIAEEHDGVVFILHNVFRALQLVPIEWAQQCHHQPGANGIAVPLDDHRFQLLFQCRIIAPFFLQVQEALQLVHVPLGQGKTQGCPYGYNYQNQCRNHHDGLELGHKGRRIRSLAAHKHEQRQSRQGQHLPCQHRHAAAHEPHPVVYGGFLFPGSKASHLIHDAFQVAQAGGAHGRPCGAQTHAQVSITDGHDLAAEHAAKKDQPVQPQEQTDEQQVNRLRSLLLFPMRHDPLYCFPAHQGAQHSQCHADEHLFRCNGWKGVHHHNGHLLRHQNQAGNYFVISVGVGFPDLLMQVRHILRLYRAVEAGIPPLLQLTVANGDSCQGKAAHSHPSFHPGHTAQQQPGTYQERHRLHRRIQENEPLFLHAPVQAQVHQPPAQNITNRHGQDGRKQQPHHGVYFLYRVKDCHQSADQHQHR